jgi:transposase
MTERSTCVPEFVMGLDLGDKYCYDCVLDHAAEAVDVGRVKTNLAGLARLSRAYPSARVVMEVGTHSAWISAAFIGWGHEVVVANSNRLAAISRDLKKSDGHDAELLARLGRADVQLLKPIEHRSKEVQLMLMQLRARAAMVRSRTMQINAVRGFAKSAGAAIPKCSAESFPRQASQSLPADILASLQRLIVAIASLNLTIRRAERDLEHIAASLAATVRLRQVAGVGLLTSLCFVLTIEDPHRFAHRRDVAAYLGLTPRRRQSGDRDPQLGITKAGSTDMRALLIQAAQYILGAFGPPSALRDWGLRLADRSGKRHALTAVARKLSVLLLALWLDKTPYDPMRGSTAAVAA